MVDLFQHDNSADPSEGRHVLKDLSRGNSVNPSDG
jgi:hypothetical protein